ncbi:hypothetical protein WICPIJ_000357 [Wickerhamomyces pijperi]|uniref:Major facilitator superfamily (MFS) profile domain-containing protein n=1 Tax=Wickerhamomyces pijperi TaxID=599730 RepID=A0A9P8TRY3_WICPI|nr:hypothetical protein WICPIJ_000357 [Wickerhamomyces pijperi]
MSIKDETSELENVETYDPSTTTTTTKHHLLDLQRAATNESIHQQHEIELNIDVDVEHEGVILEDEAPDLSLSNIAYYFLRRVPTLFQFHFKNASSLNPIPNLREMTLSNWNYFALGWLSWFSAAFDFFLTAVAGTQIAASLNVSTADITWGLSAVLMLRSCGAVIFGVWTDNYSRKWPFIFCAFMFLALQIGTGFCTNFHQFLAVRALSGVAMGGTYGTSSTCCLDDAPVKARSFLSGLLFTAYPLSFVFAAIFWRAFESLDTKTWQSLFWFSSFIPALIIVWRLFFPETKYFERLLKAKEIIKQEQIEAGTYIKPTFMTRLSNLKGMANKHWLMFIYLVLLLAFSNYLTHASEDLYPTMLRKQLGLSENKLTVIIVITNLGGVLGSLVSGSAMEVIGRRNALLYSAIIAGVMTYPAYMLQSDAALFAGGFFLFFGVNGVWGALPIHLSELSPPEARALVSGLAYQLGNLASAASSTIETRLADQWPLYDPDGKFISDDYAKVMCVLTGAVCIYGVVTVLVGPEKFHRNLSSPVMNKYLQKVIEREENEKSQA